MISLRLEWLAAEAGLWTGGLLGPTWPRVEGEAPMFVLAISVAVVALVLAVLFFAVVAGIRQAHPTDLALQRPTCLAAFAGWVLGLYVRRVEPAPRADAAAGRDRAMP